MLVMLSRLSTSRSRPSLSPQLIRHFSIRVSPRKKKSLLAEVLRGGKSPVLTKSAPKGELSLAGPARSGAKATPFYQQGEAFSRSVYLHPPPPGLSAELGGLENCAQKDKRLVKNDTCSDDIAKPSMRSKKEVQRSNISAELSVPQLREGSKEDHRECEAQLSVLSKLSVPSRIKGSKAHHSTGDRQPHARAQVGSKIGQASNCDEEPFQTEKRKVPAEASVQPQVAREESSHSHVPAETKPGGKSLSLQIREASQNPCCFVNKWGDTSLNTDFSKEKTSLASEVGGEPGKCTSRKLSSSEYDEDDDVRNNFFKLKSAVGRELSKRLEVEKLVELYSEMIRKEIPDSFLNDWQQMSREMDRFFNDLQQKIDFMIVESVSLVHVKALLMNRVFLSASPKKLAEVLTVLKLFFESGDKASEMLTCQTSGCWPQVEHLQQKFKVFVEFDVDKATCYRLTNQGVKLRAERIRRKLSFLKDLGLSAESRNRMLYRYPSIIEHSVEKRMRLIVNFCESIGIAGRTLLKLLESCPAVLCTSIENLRAMYKLCQHLGLSSAEFTKVLRHLRYIRTDWSLQYNLFKEQGFSDEAFASIISKNPQIFTYSVASVEAKLHFLLHKAKWDISEVLVFPRFFNYSLANRIIPRFKLLEERNLPRRPALHTLIASKDLGFLTV